MMKTKTMMTITITMSMTTIDCDNNSDNEQKSFIQTQISQKKLRRVRSRESSLPVAVP